MASIPQSDLTAGRSSRRQEALEYRITRLAIFAVLLVCYLLAWPFRLFQTPRSGPRAGVFRTAWEKANAAVGFVFMS